MHRCKIEQHLTAWAQQQQLEYDQWLSTRPGTGKRRAASQWHLSARAQNGANENARGWTRSAVY